MKYKMRKSPAVYNKLISLWSMLVVWQLQDHISIKLPTYPAIFLARLSVVASINLCKIELSLLSQKAQRQLEEGKPFIARENGEKKGCCLFKVIFTNQEMLMNTDITEKALLVQNGSETSKVQQSTLSSTFAATNLMLSWRKSE